jgi:hypothetical protein
VKGPGRSKAKVPGPPGGYRWYVVYYESHLDDFPPTYWQVRVKHDGEVDLIDGWLYEPGECSKIFALKVHPPRDPTPDATAQVMKHPGRNDPAEPGARPQR